MPDFDAVLVDQRSAVEGLHRRVFTVGRLVGGLDDPRVAFEGARHIADAFLRLAAVGLLHGLRQSLIHLLGRLPLAAGTVIPLHWQRVERGTCLPIVFGDHRHAMRTLGIANGEGSLQVRKLRILGSHRHHRQHARHILDASGVETPQACPRARALVFNAAYAMLGRRTSMPKTAEPLTIAGICTLAGAILPRNVHCARSLGCGLLVEFHARRARQRFAETHAATGRCMRQPSFLGHDIIGLYAPLLCRRRLQALTGARGDLHVGFHAVRSSGTATEVADSAPNQRVHIAVQIVTMG